MNIRYSAPISIGMLARRPCSARRRFRPLARALRSSGTSLQARAFSFQSMDLCTCLKRKLSFLSPVKYDDVHQHTFHRGAAQLALQVAVHLLAARVAGSCKLADGTERAVRHVGRLRRAPGQPLRRVRVLSKSELQRQL